MGSSKFLAERYADLPGSKPVESAVKKSIREGKKGPTTKESRVDAYLDRLERLIIDPQKKQRRTEVGGKDKVDRPRALSLLREMVMDKYVRTNKEKLAQNAAAVEERAAGDLGINLRYGAEQLAARGEIAIEDLENSLDQWINYLSDPNEPYPTWFRYYAFRNILDLGEYDKDKREFPRRTAGTNRLFPDIDRGALAFMQDIIEASKDPQALERLRTAQAQAGTPADQLLTAEKAKAFANLPFAKQYAEAMRQAGEITPELRAETRGEWRTYLKGSGPTALWASLQNKGTAWCTKGYGTAKTQLESGDFHVYYTLDKQGAPTIPRIAIRMQEDSIFEVRGVADTRQNLEGNMVEIADKFMLDNELPGKEKFEKASADMNMMTAIYNKCFRVDRKTGQKTCLDPELTKEELIFLYEINGPIQGFGYEEDKRIKELRQQRNPKADAPLVFDCRPNQIAWGQNEIKKDTKAYVGPLFPNIFQTLKNLEHIYTAFPEGKIRREDITVGGKNAEQLITEIEKNEMQVSNYAKAMMRKTTTTDKYGVFTAQTKSEEVNLVRLTVGDLGFTRGATTDQIYAKIKEFGLELCPAEVGPHYRLKYTDQPMGEYLFVGMKQISDPGGFPVVFDLERVGGGVWLHFHWAGPGFHWNPGSQFVFRLRK